MPHNYAIALLITFLAGLATAIGSVFAFVLKKDNLKALSVGLGFSAGVMIFLSFTDIIPSAQEMLKTAFPNNSQWIVRHHSSGANMVFFDGHTEASRHIWAVNRAGSTSSPVIIKQAVGRWLIEAKWTAQYQF